MKHLMLYILGFVGCVMLTACGGGDSPESVGSTEPNYQQGSETFSIPEEGCETTYTISLFNSQITTVTSTPDWLTITILPYTSGSPSIHISAKENPLNQERGCSVFMKDGGNTLTLTVTQAASTVVVSDVEIKNEVSVNPAYSKRQSSEGSYE